MTNQPCRYCQKQPCQCVMDSDINASLCLRDPRNPLHEDVYWDEEEFKRAIAKDVCHCDSCHSGTARLAEHCLQLEATIDQMYENGGD